MQNLNSLSEKEKKQLSDSIDTIVTDCDGVLWIGGGNIPGATDVINTFKTKGKRTIFLTNNSRKTREDLFKTAKKGGFNVTIDEMITSAWLTAAYLQSINFKKRAYIIGCSSISEELRAVGIDSIGPGPDPYFSGAKNLLVDEPNIGAVIVGHDIHFSFIKMCRACNYLNNPECLFIATNTDPYLPLPDNKRAPGAGSFVKAIETCVERTPIIMGKPSKSAADQVVKSKSLNPERCLMIGDRTTTDIAFGNVTSMKTLFVLSGSDDLNLVKQLEKNGQKDLLPTYYSNSIADLLEIIKL